MSTTVVRKKGQITLPIKVREECDIKENDALRVIPLKSKAMLIIPATDPLQRMLEKSAANAKRKGITLEDMLTELREIRKKA